MRVPEGPASLDGVDLSHHNPITLDGLKAAQKAGVRFVFHKTTEGSTVVDSTYAARRAMCAQLGIPFGAYHFARPDKDGKDAAVEALAFLAAAKIKPGDMAPMLDLEDMGGLSRSALTKWVGEWVAAVTAVVRVKPFIYTPFDLDDTFGCLLWVARYNDAMKPPRVPAPWKTWAIWQFTNGQDGLPKITPGLGAVDGNTAADLTAVLAQRVPTLTAPKKTLRIATYNVERDRPTSAVIAELKTLTRGRDVILLQEANDYGDALAKPDAIPGYVYVGFTLAREQNETAILVRDTLQLANAGVEKRTTAGWTTVKGGKTPPKWSSKVTVEGVEFSSEHLAPSQQPVAKRKLMPARARSYDEHMGNLRGGERVVRAGDWNVTPGDKTVPSFPARRLPAIGLAIAAPSSGTHGKRTIGYFAASGVKVSGVAVIGGTWGSDHKPVEATITY